MLARGAECDKVIHAIVNAGGISVNKVGDKDATQSWYKTIDVGRNVKVMKLIEFEALAKTLPVGTRLFAKTIKKSDFSEVCEVAENGNWYSLKNNHRVNYFHRLRPDDLIIVSDIRELAPAPKGERKEWRAIVQYDKLVAVYTYNKLWKPETNPEVIKFIKEKIEENKGRIPASYNIDIMEVVGMPHKFEITEFNALSSVGAPIVPLFRGLPHGNYAEIMEKRKQYITKSRPLSAKEEAELKLEKQSIYNNMMKKIDESDDSTLMKLMAKTRAEIKISDEK